MDRRSEAYANQYAFNDFGIRQVALLMNKTADVTTFTNRSLVSWNETVRHARRTNPPFSPTGTCGMLMSKATASKVRYNIDGIKIETQSSLLGLHAKTICEWNIQIY